MAQVSVLALGNWGAALAYHLASKGIDVLGWSRDPKAIEGVQGKGHHSVSLDSLVRNGKVKISADLHEALQSEIVVLAFPSAALGEMSTKLNVNKRHLLVSLIKGFEERSLLTPLGFLKKSLGKEFRGVVLSGPSFAADIAAGNPAGVVAASDSSADAKRVAELFGSAALRVYLSDDPLGVELGGALKNVVAIAAGVCDGLRLGDSARAGLITRGLAEMTRLGVAMGADAQTFAGLSGLGDLVMTASSEKSRNYRLGLALGHGEELSQAVRKIGSAVEGVSSAPRVVALAKKHGVEMPIAEAVKRLLDLQWSAPQMVKELLSRPMKHELA